MGLGHASCNTCWLVPSVVAAFRKRQRQKKDATYPVSHHLIHLLSLTTLWKSESEKPLRQHFYLHFKHLSKQCLLSAVLEENDEILFTTSKQFSRIFSSVLLLYRERPCLLQMNLIWTFYFHWQYKKKHNSTLWGPKFFFPCSPNSAQSYQKDSDSIFQPFQQAYLHHVFGKEIFQQRKWSASPCWPRLHGSVTLSSTQTTTVTSHFPQHRSQRCTYQENLEFQSLFICSKKVGFSSSFW